MNNKKVLPIGVENFSDLRKSKYYYIDKTKFISDLLQNMPTVSLITRPRRFGKTLMMSMLKEFFDITKDNGDLFDGLYISSQSDICDDWMNQWPVLFITFKAMGKTTFEKNTQEFSFDVAGLCEEHRYLLDSQKVSEADKKRFARLREQQVSESELEQSLFILMRMLYDHYGKKVILLIDEYDVPLAKSNEYGYYERMIELIRGIMNRSLKTNQYLKFAVVTGCLRMAKESIFTGVNHLDVHSIYKGGYMDCFGFTEHEIKHLLCDMGYEDEHQTVKEWYDGYKFGSYDIYCPWDVINHVEALKRNPNARPDNYWKNTSHNDIIKRFIGRTEFYVNDKFELLLAGNSITTRIVEDLTYDFDQSSETNFWSLLYLTGYLTLDSGNDYSECERLRIPNEEVKTIFADTIVEWFKEDVSQKDCSELLACCWKKDDTRISELLSDILFETISYYDYREDFYHAFLAGIFSGQGNYVVKSNRESGVGRSDIIIKDPSKRAAIVFEVKHSQGIESMDADCHKALAQIRDRRYDEEIRQEGYHNVICIGITFYKKICKVISD